MKVLSILVDVVLLRVVVEHLYSFNTSIDSVNNCSILAESLHLREILEGL